LVDFAGFYELFVGSVADFFAFVQHQDMVGMEKGAYPLGGDDGGGAGVFLAQGLP